MVDHRARNVLAVVNGIVRLSRTEDAAHYAEAVQQRVKALADAHTLLADLGWREAPLDSIIRQQLPAAQAAGNLARITVAGPPVMVSAVAVQPLALVIHELLANAAVHGALSAPLGRVDISWAETGDPTGFTLRWQETGGPEPRSVRPQGFGAAMLTAMIERQLRGQVRNNWNPQGLIAVMSIPSGQGALASRF